jgi:hypothetical protein
LWSTYVSYGTGVAAVLVQATQFSLPHHLLHHPNRQWLHAPSVARMIVMPFFRAKEWFHLEGLNHVLYKQLYNPYSTRKYYSKLFYLQKLLWNLWSVVYLSSSTLSGNGLSLFARLFVDRNPLVSSSLLVDIVGHGYGHV